MKWYILQGGEIVFTGSETECDAVVEKDETGELEMYPENAYDENLAKSYGY